MSDVTTVGIDLAKNVFSLHGVDAEGAVVLRRSVNRAKLLAEALHLRVHVDLGQRQLVVRDAKGMKDRVTVPPDVLVEPLRRRIAALRASHERWRRHHLHEDSVQRPRDHSSRRDRETGLLSYLASFVCNAPSRIWL